MTTANKKIEIPTGDETFISLQKSVNDSDMSMEVKLKMLYDLQQTDTKIDRIHLLRGELPLEVQDLEDTIAGLQTRISNLETEIKDAEKAITTKKHEIEDHKALIRKYEGQKENVRNNREYDSLIKDIEYEGLEVELAEKKIREFSQAIMQKDIAVKESREILEQKELDLENKRKELESITEETAKEEEILNKKSEELQSMIDPRLLNAYRKVRNNARNRLAVVTVKRDACGGCFNKIPPQRQLEISMSKKIIVCEYCGRIIVSSDFEKEEQNQ